MEIELYKLNQNNVCTILIIAGNIVYHTLKWLKLISIKLASINSSTISIIITISIPIAPNIRITAINSITISITTTTSISFPIETGSTHSYNWYQFLIIATTGISF